MLEQEKSGYSCLNAEAFERAKAVIPGGVDSPVRAFGSVGGAPRFIARAKGAHLWDLNGKKYIDFVGSWGPMLLGHAHPKIIGAVQAQAEHGLSYGAPCELETVLAEKIMALMPNLEKIRFVSSGTEACMTALRLARGFTGRDKFIKFEGCYHGHSDALLVKAGSGCLTFGAPSSAGVPSETVKNTLNLEFNNLDQLESVFKTQGEEIAAVIVEPIAGNMNMILPRVGFLEKIRALCTQYGAVLIFDEVMTGFRVAQGGAQKIYNIEPDLTTLAKVIGGGMPVGAVAGRREIMDYLSPLGPVYQAGTLSGNPLAMAAGIAMIDLLSDEHIYQKLGHETAKFCKDVEAIAEGKNLPLKTVSMGGMFGLFFVKNLEDPLPQCFSEAMACDEARFKKFFHAALNHGIYWPASRFEAAFMSTAHLESGDEKTPVLERALMNFDQIFDAIR
jgi:glutamate-1-semialdehyde 2,1-aminomutase